MWTEGISAWLTNLSRRRFTHAVAESAHYLNVDVLRELGT